MRESKPQILKNAKGEPCGIMLEASYCAEQEQGIKPLEQLFRAGTLEPAFQNREYRGPWGLELRRVTQAAESQTYWAVTPKRGKTAKKWTLSVQTGAHIAAGYLGDIPRWDRLPKPYNGGPTHYSVGAWDDRGFLCCSNDPEMGEILTGLHEALMDPTAHAVAIWTGGAGNNPFARNGLCLGLIDKIDPESLKVAEETDRGRIELHWKAEDTGIPALIPKNRYYALSPGTCLKSRIKPGADAEDRKTPDVIETAYEIMFFLNPREQQMFNHGWFTVEELRAWQNGEPSPVFKVQPEK